MWIDAGRRHLVSRELCFEEVTFSVLGSLKHLPENDEQFQEITSQLFPFNVCRPFPKLSADLERLSCSENPFPPLAVSLCSLLVSFSRKYITTFRYI